VVVVVNTKVGQGAREHVGTLVGTWVNSEEGGQVGN
jgi:hypothetical protein